MRGFTAILLFGVLLVSCSLPAAAIEHNTDLTGIGYFDLGVAPLHAEAVFENGVWTYTYTVSIADVFENVTGFTIANLNLCTFADATNNKNFENPVFIGTDSIFWDYGDVPTDQGPVVFSVTSPYSPGMVKATLWGGYKYSFDDTLGPVPEPGTFAGMAAFGLSTLCVVARRRRGR